MHKRSEPEVKVFIEKILDHISTPDSANQLYELLSNLISSYTVIRGKVSTTDLYGFFGIQHIESLEDDTLATGVNDQENDQLIIENDVINIGENEKEESELVELLHFDQFLGNPHVTNTMQMISRLNKVSQQEISTDSQTPMSDIQVTYFYSINLSIYLCLNLLIY